MENPSKLEENMQVLEAEMLILTDLRYAGDGRLEGWLQDVKGKALDVEKLQKELDELKTGIDPNNLNARLELTKKVMEVVKDIRVLIKEGNAHPDSIQRLLLELAIERPKQYSYRDLSSFTSNFYNKIGHGASGDVYKGQLPNGVQVAVKVLLEQDVVKEMFLAEVRTMGRTYHQNLIKLYGFCFEQNKKALVYEYMENGSLDKVLYENHHSIEWEKLYGIATDIAKGIAYLHDGCYEQIIHHDIKPANVLLDTKFSPKVTDFGLAKLLNRDGSHITLTRIRGTPGYLAPEMWMPASLVTYKCDVYSYGMLLFEVLGRRNNSQNNNKWFPKQVWDKFETGHLDKIIDDCGIRENNREKATVLSMVAFWCAQFTAQVRPTMSTVVKMLEKEIPITMPPNPFFPSNLTSSLQASKFPEVDHPKVAASISMQPSDLPEVIRPKVDAFISLQPSHLPETSRPKDAASFSLQSSDMTQANFGASISTQASHSRKAAHSKDGSDLELKPGGILEVKLVQAKELTNKDIIRKWNPFAKFYARQRTKTSKTIVRPTMTTAVKMLEKEIPVTIPPNPFFPSNLTSSLQASNFPEVDHPKVAASISMQPSDLPEVVRPKVDAFISLQPSHLPEASRPKDAASFLLQSSDTTQANFGASVSTQASHSGKAAHSKDGSDLELKPGGILEVKLVQAKELTNKDIIRKCNPFAKLYVRQRTKTSKTINNQLNPIWNEDFDFIVEDASTQHLVVKIFDDISLLIGSLLIGCAQVQLKDLEPGKVKDVWLKLVKDVEIQRDDKNRGQVHLELLYIPFAMEDAITNPFASNSRGVLSVTVISAEDLPASYYILDFSNPYVVTHMKNTKSINQTRRAITRVVNKNLNPVWNQTFDFVVEDSIDDMLILEVYNQDTLGKGHIGQCILTLTRVMMEGEYKDSIPIDGEKSGKLNLHLKWTFR